MYSKKKKMRLVLSSSDAKPRLKWTPELHRQFMEAVSLLGGPEKATPKCLMRVMGVPGLTLYHLKSHLQKYRLGRRKGCQSSNTHREENDPESFLGFSVADGEKDQAVVDKSCKMQMEVQRKLQEQIEVQRHLQLRIEAQGRYLQSVLKKARDTLSDYGTSTIGVQLSQLVSVTRIGGSSSSMESSLTSTEECHDNDDRPVELPLMDMGSNVGDESRTPSTISDGSHGYQQSVDLIQRIDLNLKRTNHVT